MTPVGPLVAFRATTWDAALEETLSRVIEPSSASGVSGIIHSIHQRAANILIDGTLIAVISDEFDDAPASIRIAIDDLQQLRLHQGDEVVVTPTEIRFSGADGDHVLMLQDAQRWTPASADLSALRIPDIERARASLEQNDIDAPQSPFGRASAALIAAGVSQLRTVSSILAESRAADGAPDAAVVAATGRLIGLGEGLTPTGDDIVTGLAFLAAQPGMSLGRLLPSLAVGIDAHASRTTLLSVVTMRAAGAGRGRQSMHDLCVALAAGDTHALQDAAARILAIGHSSGADLLTGLRLALELESRARATTPAADRKRSA